MSNATEVPKMTDVSNHNARMLVKLIRQAPDDWERTEQLCARALALASQPLTAETGEVTDEMAEAECQHATHDADCVHCGAKQPLIDRLREAAISLAIDAGGEQPMATPLSSLLEETLSALTGKE